MVDKGVKRLLHLVASMSLSGHPPAAVVPSANREKGKELERIGKELKGIEKNGMQSKGMEKKGKEKERKRMERNGQGW